MLRGGIVLGASANGELSQNTALAGLLSSDMYMRELAGDIR